MHIDTFSLWCNNWQNERNFYLRFYRRLLLYNKAFYFKLSIQYLHIVLLCILGKHGIGTHTIAVLVLYLGCPLRICCTHCPLDMPGLQSSFHSYPLHTLYLHFFKVHALLSPLPRTRKTNTWRRTILLAKYLYL